MARRAELVPANQPGRSAGARGRVGRQVPLAKWPSQQTRGPVRGLWGEGRSDPAGV